MIAGSMEFRVWGPKCRGGDCSSLCYYYVLYSNDGLLTTNKAETSQNKWSGTVDFHAAGASSAIIHHNGSA